MRLNRWTLLAFFPLAVLFAAVLRYRVDVPFWDEWGLIRFIEKSYLGTLTIRDLWTQENDHRLFFPKILFILTARLTGWNVDSLLLLNLLLAIGTFALLCYQTKRTLKEACCPGFRWLVLLFSLVVFSLNQWENWLWGIEICIFLNTFSVIAGLVVLSASRFRWRDFLAAFVLGVIGTYSNANGVLFWPVGLWVLASHPSAERRVKRARLGLWTILGLLVIGSYLYRYQKPSYHPSYWLWLQEPLRYARFVLTYLGVPLVSFSQKGAFAAGLGGLVLFFSIIRVLLRRREVPFQALIPWFSIGWYFLGTALMVGVGRMGLGLGWAMSAHYVTQTYPFWISLLVLMHLLFYREPARPGRSPVFLWPAALLAIALWVGFGSLLGISGFRKFHQRLSQGRAELLSRVEGTPLRRLTSMAPSQLDRMVAILRKRRLSVFRDA